MMTYEDAVDDWKSNDEWQFADRDACWRFMFEKGQESLRQQLAAALAACTLKDESLEGAHNGLRWWMDAFPLHVTEADNEEMLNLVKALAIQPDDAALKEWLGEPVSYLYKHASAFGYGEFWSHRQNHNGVTAIESKALYSPKLLK